MKSQFFMSFFYVFLFLYGNIVYGQCRDISQYLVEVGNPNFQVVKLEVKMRDGRYRSRELMVALGRRKNETSWFRVLTLIKYPLVGKPSCIL